MKSLLPAFALALIALMPTAAHGQSAQQVLSEAQTAYIRGDIEGAKRGFEMVYRMDPRNQVAINYLRLIKAQEGKAPKGSDMEHQLATVVIPKIELREATFAAALEFLRQSVAKTTNGKTAVNFVVNLPEESKNLPVTLVLTNVPFTEVLRYLGGLANVHFEYDKYAITVKPGSGAAPAAPAPAATPATPSIPGLPN
jgi:hypothetical protein